MQNIVKNNKKILKNITNSQNYGEFLKYLHSLSKHESELDMRRHKAILNTNQQVIGISMKNIRDISKQISKNCQNEFLNFVKSKKPENSFYEETLIEGLVIADIKDLDRQINLIKIWTNKIDNWATCDSVVCSLKLLKKSKNKDNYFYLFLDLAKNASEFISRFAIVVLMSIYLDKYHIDEIYKLIIKIKNDAYYTKMAISWLIASGLLVDEEKTKNLLKNKILDKFIQNKAISKCRDSFQVSDKLKRELKGFRM